MTTITTIGLMVDRKHNRLTIEMSGDDLEALIASGLRIMGTKVTFEVPPTEAKQRPAPAEPTPEGAGATFKVDDRVVVTDNGISNRDNWDGRVVTVIETGVAGPWPYRAEDENGDTVLLKASEMTLVVPPQQSAPGTATKLSKADLKQLMLVSKQDLSRQRLQSVVPREYRRMCRFETCGFVETYKDEFFGKAVWYWRITEAGKATLAALSKR